MKISFLTLCVVLCSISIASKRKFDEFDETEISDCSLDSKRKADTGILIRLRELSTADDNNEENSIAEQLFFEYLFNFGADSSFYDISDLAKNISWLYDSLINSGMQHLVSQLFKVIAGAEIHHNFVMDELFCTVLIQELVSLQFEGWAELLDAAIQEDASVLFSATLLSIPQDRALFYKIFHSICSNDSESTKKDSSTVYMLYLFMKFKNIHVNLDLEDFVSFNLPDQFEDSLVDLIALFNVIPSDRWDLDTVLGEFAQIGIARTIIQYSLPYLKHLEDGERWKEALSIRLKLIGNMEMYVDGDFLEQQKALYNGSACLDDTYSIKITYDQLIEEIKVSPSLLNRSFDLIIEENVHKAIYPLLNSIPEAINDFVIRIMAKVEDPDVFMEYLANDMKELNLKINFDYQNGRIPLLALQMNFFEIFMTHFKESINNVTDQVYELVHHHLKLILINQNDFDPSQLSNLISGLNFLATNSNQFKDLLITVIDHKFDLLMIIAPRLNISLWDETKFPLSELARRAIQSGNVVWCEALSVEPEGENYLSLAAAILVSEDFIIPDCVKPYLGMMDIN